MKMDELMKCTNEELKEQLDNGLQLNRYKHDMAALFGSVGMSPRQYTEFMKTIDKIEAMKNN